MNYKLEMASTVTWTEIDGQTVLFSKATGDMFGLNQSGAYLVKELLASDFSSTVTKAAQAFEVDQQIIATDLGVIVDSLLKSKLVTQTLTS